MKEKKKRLSFKFFKKHKKLAIIIIIALILSSSFAFINYSRYVKDVIYTYYLRTKGFYFTSNRLDVIPRTYNTNPWVISAGDYNINFRLSTEYNSIKKMKEDLEYTTDCQLKKITTNSLGTVTREEDVNFASCNIDSTNNIIYGENSSNNNKNIKDITATIHIESLSEAKELEEGTTVEVTITVNSIRPYRHTLSGKFRLIVGTYGVIYEIDDKENRRYVDCIITNTDRENSEWISVNINEGYNKNGLNGTDELIVFDQNNAILDIMRTSGEYHYDNSIERPNYDKTYVIVEDNSDVQNKKVLGVNIKLGPKSSTLIRYYKKDPKNNFYYRSNSNEEFQNSVISVTTITDTATLNKLNGVTGS